MKLISTFILLSFSIIAIAKPNPVHEYTLKNGLKVFVKTDKRAPIATFQIWYKVGSADEPNGITGISHMLEHMMFRGTKKFPKNKVSEIFAQSGADQNAVTTSDYTKYFQSIPSNKIKLNFEIEADRMRNIVLDKEALATEKQAVLEELRMSDIDPPMSYAMIRLSAAAFLNNPYHHPIGGWISDVEQYTLIDVQSWYNKWYHPNNAIIVIVGDVDPEKMHQYAKQYFGKIPKVTLPERKTHRQPTPSGTKMIDVHHPAAVVPSVTMAFNTPSLTSSKEKWQPYALSILAYILGGSQSARLQTNLDRKQNLAVDIGAGYTLLSRYSNLFIISASPTKGNKLDDIIHGTWQEIKRLAKHPPSEAEMQRVKSMISKDHVFSMDDISTQADLIGLTQINGLSTKWLDNYQNTLFKITPQQVQAVAKKFLTQKNQTIMYLLPQEEEIK